MKSAFILTLVIGSSLFFGCKAHNGNPTDTGLGDQASGQEAAEHVRDLITGSCDGKAFIWDWVSGEPTHLGQAPAPVEFTADEVRPFEHLFGIEARGHAQIGKSRDYASVRLEMFRQDGDWFVVPDGNQKEIGAVKVNKLRSIPTDCKDVLQVLSHY